MRPEWDEYFMALAKLASARSTCNSRPTGAVLVRDNTVLSTGYNGALPGVAHCSDQPAEAGIPYCFSRKQGATEQSKYNYCRSNHAEANAVAQAARHGISLQGATAYITLAPCYNCVKLLAAAGIRRVYYELEYESTDPARDAFWKNVCREIGIETYEKIILTPTAADFFAGLFAGPTSERRLPPRSV